MNALTKFSLTLLVLLSGCTAYEACPDLEPMEVRHSIDQLRVSWEATLDVALDESCVDVVAFKVSDEEYFSQCPAESVSCTVMCGEDTQSAYIREAAGAEEDEDSWIHEVAHFWMHCSEMPDDPEHVDKRVWSWVAGFRNRENVR